MPRLDNSAPEVIEELDLRFFPDDPGRTPPVDLCWNCWHNVYGWDPMLEIDHPPYQEQAPPYHCHECGVALDVEDESCDW